MVSAVVVEQVYSNTFKFCLLKMQEICSLKRLIFTSKCTKNAFDGRAPPGLGGGAYSATPGPLPGLREKEKEEEWKGGKGRGVQRHPPATQNA